MSECGAAAVPQVMRLFSDGSYSAILTIGAALQCLAFHFLLSKVQMQKSVAGLSMKTLEVRAIDRSRDTEGSVDFVCLGSFSLCFFRMDIFALFIIGRTTGFIRLAIGSHLPSR